jgi:hypothetical protein
MLASVQPLANAAGLTSLALQKEVALMKRIVLMVTVAMVMALMMALAGPASATIHPLVESVDCANYHAGDPAEVLGQDPEAGNHSDQSSLRAIQEANDSAFSDFKLNGTCGAGA